MPEIDVLFRDRIIEISPMRLGDVDDNPRNPKSHPDRQGRAIRGLVSQIGWAGVPLVYRSERTGKLTFVDGHLRKREFPDATVRVAVTDLTDAEADALLITYDPIAQLAETNKEEFARLIADVQPTNPDMQDLLEAIARKLKIEPNSSEGDSTEDVVSRAIELQDKWNVQPGDIWMLDSGNGHPHLVICGDSTDPSVIERLMHGERARMCMTDPPYNVAYKGGAGSKNRRDAIANDKLDAAAWLKFVHAFGTRIRENCTGDVYIWGTPGIEGEIMRLHLSQGVGLHWASTIIWVKDQFTLGGGKYQHQHEDAYHGYVEASSENALSSQPPDASLASAHNTYDVAVYGWFEGRSSSFNDESRNLADVWFVDRPSSSPEHPTMKPIELMEVGIRNSSRPGDLVIDFFLGSGSTLLACENLARRCKGAELEPRYVSVVLERFQLSTGCEPLLVYPNRTTLAPTPPPLRIDSNSIESGPHIQSEA